MVLQGLTSLLIGISMSVYYVSGRFGYCNMCVRSCNIIHLDLPSMCSWPVLQSVVVSFRSHIFSSCLIIAAVSTSIVQRRVWSLWLDASFCCSLVFRITIMYYYFCSNNSFSLPAQPYLLFSGLLFREGLYHCGWMFYIDVYLSFRVSICIIISALIILFFSLSLSSTSVLLIVLRFIIQRRVWSPWLDASFCRLCVFRFIIVPFLWFDISLFSLFHLILSSCFRMYVFFKEGLGTTSYLPFTCASGYRYHHFCFHTSLFLSLFFLEPCCCFRIHVLLKEGFDGSFWCLLVLQFIDIIVSALRFHFYILLFLLCLTSLILPPLP